MKMKRYFFLALLIYSASASGAIVGGTATKISPPLNTGNDNQQVNELLGFDEQQYVVLISDLVVDNPSGVIPAGTVVSSHYVIYDPASNRSITGDVVVDQDIVGVIYKTATLNNSDFLGIPSTNYLNPSLRGYESGDTATIDNLNTVSFDLSAQSPGDYARIITATDFAIQGPQLLMRSPQVVAGGVHTNTEGVGSVRILFNEPVEFQSNDITVTNEDSRNITAYSTGSSSPFMVITFQDVLQADRYTITVHDTVVSVDDGAAIDGNNDGSAGGDLVFTMEHRRRTDNDNDNDVDLSDLAKFALDWLWAI